MHSKSAYLKALWDAHSARQKMMTFVHRSTDYSFYGVIPWLIVLLAVYFMDVTLWLIIDSLSAYLKSLSPAMMR
jgi:hypothetical protein